MSIFTRFFGKQEEDDERGVPLAANPKIENPLSLQLLFADGLKLEPAAVTDALRSYHASMAGARCEIDSGLSQEGKIFGLAGWAKHVIRLVGFASPMPRESAEACIAPAHYPEELKQRARAHTGHLLLYYGGYDPSPLEEYVALAAVSGALSHLGAIVVLNESAHTSFPAAALSETETDGDIIDLLRSLPLPVLYCGFVKYEVDGIPGVWLRTHGANLLNRPDLAAHAAGHHEGTGYFETFDSVLRYLSDSGAELADGHTMQLGEDEYLRFRAPAADEPFLDGPDQLLVVETISAHEINH